MKTIYIKGLLALGLVATLASCSDDDELMSAMQPQEESVATSSSKSLSKAAYSYNGASYNLVSSNYNGSGRSVSASAWNKTVLDSDVKIESGVAYQIKFSCMTVGNNNWETPTIMLTNKSGQNVACLRSDNAAFTDALGSTWANSSKFSGWTISSNWDWNNFTANLTNSNYEVTIINKGNGYADVLINVTTSNGNVYFQNYKNIPVTASDLYMRLSGEVWTGKFDFTELTSYNGENFKMIESPYNNTGRQISNTSGWENNVLDSDIKIDSKTIYHLSFRLNTVGASNWNTPNVYLPKNQTCLRTDNYGWNGKGNTGDKTVNWTLENNWNWNTFLSVLKGSIYDLKLINKGNNQADILISVKGSDGQTYYQNYKNVTVNSNNMYFRLTGDAGTWTGIFQSQSKGSGFVWLDKVSWGPNSKYPDDYRTVGGAANYKNWNLANVHDPSVCYYNGKYYMWATDGSFGDEHLRIPGTTGKHFPGKYSTDLVNWTYCPGPFQEPPSWIMDTINAQRKRLGLSSNLKASQITWNYWAPVVKVVNGKIRMYYSIGPSDTYDFTSNTWTMPAYIGMCETTNPEGGASAWKDYGYVSSSSSDKGKSFYKVANTNWGNASYYYNAIDPSYIITPEGKHYLIYGSWHSGFTCMELNPSTGKPKYNNGKLGELYANSVSEMQARFGKRVFARNTSRWQGAEAPDVIYKDGYYYMFMAWDELAFAYNSRVVRATSVTGPYKTSRGVDMTNGGNNDDKVYPIVTHPYKFKDGAGWAGIAHCTVFKNEETGDWMYMSQQKLPRGLDDWFPEAMQLGGVRKLVWCPADGNENSTDLWPIALPERYAATHKHNSRAISDDDIYGHYELINLAYTNGTKQCEPAKNYLVFYKDHTYSCEGLSDMSGTWEYIPGKKYIKLTSANGKFNGTGNILKTMIICVERELDWERNTESIVFAGFHKNNTCTYWGKKVANFVD